MERVGVRGKYLKIQPLKTKRLLTPTLSSFGEEREKNQIRTLPTSPIYGWLAKTALRQGEKTVPSRKTISLCRPAHFH
jgi:hypothetical protein